jgi:hypothetical protein
VGTVQQDAPQSADQQKPDKADGHCRLDGPAAGKRRPQDPAGTHAG